MLEQPFLSTSIVVHFFFFSSFFFLSLFFLFFSFYIDAQGPKREPASYTGGRAELAPRVRKTRDTRMWWQHIETERKMHDARPGGANGLVPSTGIGGRAAIRGKKETDACSDQMFREVTEAHTIGKTPGPCRAVCDRPDTARSTRKTKRSSCGKRKEGCGRKLVAKEMEKTHRDQQRKTELARQFNPNTYRMKVGG
jgi:hypothetical protein